MAKLCNGNTLSKSPQKSVRLYRTYRLDLVKMCIYKHSYHTQTQQREKEDLQAVQRKQTSPVSPIHSICFHFAALSLFMSNQHASSPFHHLTFLFCFACITRRHHPSENGEKKEDMQEDKNERGRRHSSETIWVFPASSSHFGTAVVFFPSSSLCYMLCLFCVPMLYLSLPSLTI